MLPCMLVQRKGPPPGEGAAVTSGFPSWCPDTAGAGVRLSHALGSSWPADAPPHPASPGLWPKELG